MAKHFSKNVAVKMESIKDDSNSNTLQPTRPPANTAKHQNGGETIGDHVDTSCNLWWKIHILFNAKYFL